MSLLENNAEPISAAVTIANNIKTTPVGLFNLLISYQNRGIDSVWSDSNLTPKEIVTELGTDAGKIFQLHGALTDFIKQVAAIDGIDVSDKLKYPKKNFTINADGTVTIKTTNYTPA